MKLTLFILLSTVVFSNLAWTETRDELDTRAREVENYLHVSFACSEKMNPMPIPARYKKVSWRMQENAAGIADITSGEARTDQDGHFIVVIDSKKTDLSKSHFEFLIGGSILKSSAADGPHIFDALPYEACIGKKLK